MNFFQHHHLLEKNTLRPLLDLTKNEILEICKKHHIPYMQDETNKDVQTSLRNFIRIKILPKIYKLSTKTKKEKNSFIQSFQNIYKQLDTNKKDIPQLKDIKKSPYRNYKFAYELNIFKKLLTQQDLIKIMKNL
jgi:tRNA(Ile)-lysidine synthase TilS/MesJ